MARYIKDPPKQGRPRKYDLYKEAEDLNEWSLKEDSIYLEQFTDKKDYSATSLANFSDLNPSFAEALKKAKDRISLRMKQGVNSSSFNYGIWNRYAAVNDGVLHQHERSDIEHKIDYEYNKKMEIAQSLNISLPPNDALLALKHENEDQQALIAQMQRTIDELKQQAATEHSRSD